ncbi:hypothetical protein B0H14DRAFT_3425556 [Mycena olivaceomarginata]|nr:hypothetical protein B0H14DRAFT_3425556 [Mycena olivaceomarginata]
MSRENLLGQLRLVTNALPVKSPGWAPCLVEFDQLPVECMCARIAGLIDMLSSIHHMKYIPPQAQVKPGKSKPRLKEIENANIIHPCDVAHPALGAGSLSSSILASAAGRLYTDQFRFSVGVPNAEAKFQKALAEELAPGVYVAKEAQTLMGHYAAGGRVCWRKSKLGPTSCVALAEVVNLPKQFMSSNPHFVVRGTEWIMCYVPTSVPCVVWTSHSGYARSRCLLIKGLEAPAMDSLKGKKKSVIPLVKLDPAQTNTLMSKALQDIPAARVHLLYQELLPSGERVNNGTPSLLGDDIVSLHRKLRNSKEIDKFGGIVAVRG